MKIGITGVSGFLGRHIAREAARRGWIVTGFSRTPAQSVEGCAEMRLLSMETAPDVAGLDAVVHLAGESILGLWTTAKRRRIRESRVLGTRRIVEAFRICSTPPAKFVCCSAVGYYGDTGGSIVDETAPRGHGFLSDVASQWETEALAAQKSGTSVALMRVGFVLGSDGGAMNPIRRIFNMGLGGRLGSGNQWMSLVHVDDVAGLFLAAVEQQNLVGPVNVCMPEPCRNADFTRWVSGLLGRPARLPVPAFALRAVLGEVSRIALDSIGVIPRRAMEAGYAFRFADAQSAIAAALRPASRT